MSSPNLPPTNALSSSAKKMEDIEQPPQAAPISFGEQIKRGWDWVVFVWQMLRRLGGPLDWLLAFWTLISLLLTRLLTQLGVLKK